MLPLESFGGRNARDERRFGLTHSEPSNKLNDDSLARAQHPQRAVRGGAAMRDLHRFIQGDFNFQMGPTRRSASDCVDDRFEFVVDPMGPLAQQQLLLQPFQASLAGTPLLIVRR